MTELYAGDAYATPPGTRLRPLARVLGWTRIPFYWYTARQVIRARAKALRGEYTAAAFAHDSEQIARAVEGCGGRIEVSGLDHLAAAEGSVVIVGNHMSFLETFLMPAMILPRKPVCFVVKGSLLRHPAMAAILGALDAVPLTRTNPREDFRVMMEEGQRRLESGRSLCIFPQSTRTPYFDAARFSSIGAKLAQRCGRPIVPVALRTDFLGNGRWVKDLGPVHPDRPVRFAFGPAVEASNARRAHEQAIAFITSRLSEWGVECR